MDYHADRFVDHSLLFFRNGKLYALLPANICGTTLHSHQGLTYGSLITAATAKADDICTLFAEMNEYLRREGVTAVVYKAIPWIYHTYPAEEDLYALVKVCHAQLLYRDISTAIPLSCKYKCSELRRRGAKRAAKLGVTIRESQDIAAFWQILNNNLTAKYGVPPVHSCEELQLLANRFPHNIRLIMAYNGNTPLGGTLLFCCQHLIHTQYISASPDGKASGALDLLFTELINNTNGVLSIGQANAMPLMLDFGKSTEDGGHYLNTQLIHQKEGFGGRAVCYDTYTWTL